MELYDQDAKRCCEYLQHMCSQTDEDAFLLICMRFFSIFYRFTLNLYLNTVISLTDIMLIYQPIEVLKSVLYLCNTPITTKSRSWWESHMMNQSSF